MACGFGMVRQGRVRFAIAARLTVIPFALNQIAGMMWYAACDLEPAGHPLWGVPRLFITGGLLP